MSPATCHLSPTAGQLRERSLLRSGADGNSRSYLERIEFMTSTAESLLSDIQRIAPDIAARATEIETGRDIPTDLVETLRSVGVFRLLVPCSHGGLELELPVAAEVIAALAKIEGSVGWIAMIAGVTQLLAALLPRETYDQIYRNGPDVIFAGSNQPAGTAEATSGGWRVGGRWPFASGSRHANWIIGYCVMMKDGAPLAGPVAGASLMQGFFMPAHHWQIEDTWYVAGLKGTGSPAKRIAYDFICIALIRAVLRSRACNSGLRDLQLVAYRLGNFALRFSWSHS